MIIERNFLSTNTRVSKVHISSAYNTKSPKDIGVRQYAIFKRHFVFKINRIFGPSVGTVTVP
jgi:hypothetical protein